MSDLVNDLRLQEDADDEASMKTYRLLLDAADEIERLRDEVDQLRTENAAYDASEKEARNQLVRMDKALCWIVENPAAHPANMVAVAQDALTDDLGT